MIGTLDHLMDIPGFMELDELEWLDARASEFETVLEVGCWYGRSTSALAHGCRGQVWTVDHFEGSPTERDGAHADVATIDVGRMAEENLHRFDHVDIIRGSSLEASRTFGDESIEMVFLDGDHTREAVLVDLISWRPKCSRLLCGHDRNWEGVYGALAVYGVPFDLGPGSIWFMEIR